MNEFVAYLAVFTIIAASLWAAIHGLQKLTPIGDRWTALIVGVLGIFAGCVAQGCGWVQAPTHGAWAWVSAGLFGLFGALAAAGGTDLNIIKPAAAGGTP